MKAGHKYTDKFSDFFVFFLFLESCKSSEKKGSFLKSQRTKSPNPYSVKKPKRICFDSDNGSFPRYVVLPLIKYLRDIKQTENEICLPTIQFISNKSFFLKTLKKIALITHFQDSVAVAVAAGAVSLDFFSPPSPAAPPAAAGAEGPSPPSASSSLPLPPRGFLRLGGLFLAPIVCPHKNKN